jgi:hypothetical protein
VEEVADEIGNRVGQVLLAQPAYGGVVRLLDEGGKGVSGPCRAVRVRDGVHHKILSEMALDEKRAAL